MVQLALRTVTSVFLLSLKFVCIHIR